MSTSAGWDGVLDGIINEEDCEEPDNDRGYPGNCGSSTIGITYLLSYLVISFLIVINMYIAVILENYSQATEDVQEGLTDDDYDMYYEIWQQFDPEGTQYIRYDQLSDFLDVLEPPLQIHKPNKYKIISMDIPICRNDMMFCVDILDALTKDFFARKGSPIEETGELGEVAARPDEIGYEPVSSTLWRQREEYCARLIQIAWRKHKTHKPDGEDEDEDDDDEDGSDDASEDEDAGPSRRGSRHTGNGGGGGSNHNGSNNNNGSIGDNRKNSVIFNSSITSKRNSGGSGSFRGAATSGQEAAAGAVGGHLPADGQTLSPGSGVGLSSSNSQNNIIVNSAFGGGGTSKLGNGDVKSALDKVLGTAATCTAVLIESDGFVTKNGPKVVIHSRSSPPIGADV